MTVVYTVSLVSDLEMEMLVEHMRTNIKYLIKNMRKAVSK